MNTKRDPEDQISLYLGRAYYSYLGMLARLLKVRRLDDRLKPGIGNLLFTLHQENDLTAAEIGAKLGLARSTMARMVDKVRKLGLIDARPDPDDGRAIRLSLTKDAQRLMPKCYELADEIEATICYGFTKKEREMFTDLLSRATENITAKLEDLDSSSTSKNRSPKR